MVVYIEYALAENFMIDGTLLCLSLYVSKNKILWKRLLLSALVGSVFAVTFPVFALQKWLDYTLKALCAVGMCLIAYGRLKPKPRFKNFVLFTGLFFAFSFAFAGMLIAFCNSFAFNGESYTLARAPIVLTVCCGVAFVALAVALARKLYKKRAIERLLYDCVIEKGGKKVAVKGFFDSGNCAEKNGLPVCFLSPDIVYDLCGDGVWEHNDEIAISTVSGVKTMRVFLAVICVNGKRQRAYFAPAVHMISREYKLLLNARSLTGVEPPQA